VLLTRSPLSEQPKSLFTFDLHVLGTPPAFILSQDQTLRNDSSIVSPASPVSQNLSPNYSREPAKVLSWRFALLSYHSLVVNVQAFAALYLYLYKGLSLYKCLPQCI
jgi:hypothetical protein